MSQVELLDDDPYVQPLTPPAAPDPAARYRPGSRAPQRPLTPRKKVARDGYKPIRIHVDWSGRMYYSRG